MLKAWLCGFARSYRFQIHLTIQAFKWKSLGLALGPLWLNESEMPRELGLDVSVLDLASASIFVISLYCSKVVVGVFIVYACCQIEKNRSKRRLISAILPACCQKDVRTVLEAVPMFGQASKQPKE